MNEIHSLIDEIRAAENQLSAIATKRAKASADAQKASQAVQEITDKIERLHLSEKTLSETGSRLGTMASRALSRGLLQNEIQDALQPLALKDQIREASKIVTSSKDAASEASLTLQRLASEAQEELKAVEVEFAEAEDTLENLRDNLRILQAMPA
jgi:predicted  nucleic acid-binding Zn-ribbon protein